MQEQEDYQDIFPTELNQDEIRRINRPSPPFIGSRPFRWRFFLLLALGLFVIFIWPAWSAFYTEWLWFQEVGFQTVFTTLITTKLIGITIGGLFAALGFFGNLKLALKFSAAGGVPGYKFYIANQEIAVADLGNIAARLRYLLSAAAGFFFGIQCWSAWEVWLPYRYGAAFGEADPIFGYDISFYFFALPWWDFLSEISMIFTVILFIAALVIYLGRASLIFGGKNKISIQDQPRNHLLGLVAIFFIILAARDYLDLPKILLQADGTVIGAGYADVHALIPLLWAKVGVALFLPLLAIGAMLLKNLRAVILGAAIYVLVILASALYPAFVQRFSVSPNELERESPYLLNNIFATRKAYNLNQVEERELTGDSTLTAKDIQENRRTINSIRLWDQRPLLDTFAQLQEIRPYYEFKGVDNDRYQINGEMQQVMLSVRELNSSKLPNRNWINERFIFTHGNGLTLGAVNRVSPEGLPELFVKDIPPVSSIPGLKISRPEIYFGEMEQEHVYVKTKQQEFNYPEGEKNQFSFYEGTGGVLIGSYFRKLLFATRFGDLKLMLSNDITAESRVIYNRNIKERLEAVAPFLTFDRDPYLVISEEKCYWICDGYTLSNQYPNSMRMTFINQQPFNYIRNSVKAVIDAYNGSISLYIADQRDPVIKTYEKIFPGILKPLSEMPEGLRAHIRYPEDIFRIQTWIYATYHMDQPQVFYNKEDQWEIASAEERDGQPLPMDPYYTIMKLPSSEAEEFLVMLPFVPKNKQNLAAWMVARCDTENYGKLLTYRLPKQKQIYGPKQIVGRINADAEISGQLTLWSQSGSKVNFGTMLVIPIKESLLYVQPLYLQADTGKIPELKRIIVANESKISMGETLEQSLNKLFGNVSVTPAPQAETQASETPATAQPLNAAQTAIASEALQHDDRAMQALKEGDWARYGEERQKVRALLQQLAKGK